MAHLLFDKIADLLKTAAPRNQVYIPAIWLGDLQGGVSMVNYADFVIDQIDEIYKSGKTSAIAPKQDWSREAVVYNLFLRYFSAFDHDQDGKIGDSASDITVNGQGIRETGTFLKTLALLPYLSKLGINTIHLLPITEIGREGRKGDLGSPYAIKNPFKIDPLLADPIVSMPAEDQYKAFVEAAHLIGMRVVQEFIFRTASIDSELIEGHPDWFYWINKDSAYGPPKFPHEALREIKQIPKGKGRYLPPPPSYRSKFAIPPHTRNNTLKIASAFADWPPDDLQPPWTDVTYLRLYHYNYRADNNFNYIAYNTIRYYDPELAKTENINKVLWEDIEKIIPYYQRNFGIDGAMIDMGHALPDALKKRIIRAARLIDHQFAFWDENFENTIATKKEGYDAVIGGAWYNITKRTGFKKQILSFDKKLPLPYFGTSETHNSPRYGYGKRNKKIASWVLFNLLPQAIPFLHNGFELNEKLPVNTGLNFTQNDLDELKKEPLALFYKTGMNWTTKNHIISFISRFQKIKEAHPGIFDGNDLSLTKTNNPKVPGFLKKLEDRYFMVLFNTDFYRAAHFELVEPASDHWLDLIRNCRIDRSNKITLKAGAVLFALSD
jgi:starch synthase (maltosyl-transferring)